MSLISIVCAAVMAGGPIVTQAHPDHGPPVQKEFAVGRATQQIERLAKEGKVEASWVGSAKLVSAELHTGGKAKEWLVVFDNSGAADATKRRLYVYLTEAGDYVAANFSGK